MPKEYRTIQEIAGPLMMVTGVENVNYDELGEIELSNGDTRRCKVLEIDGDTAVVQLYESSTGLNLSTSKVRFLSKYSFHFLSNLSLTYFHFNRRVKNRNHPSKRWFAQGV